MSECICTVDTIKKLCGGESNAPNLNAMLSITCLDEVSDIPDPVANSATISANIAMRAAAVGPPAVTAGKFRKWFFDMKDSSYKSKKNENGLWETEVKIFIPKLKTETTHIMSGMNGDNYIALVEDMNQEGKRLIGDLINGCMIEVEETTTPKNGYDVTIKWSSKAAPYWYTGTVTY